VHLSADPVTRRRRRALGAAAVAALLAGVVAGAGHDSERPPDGVTVLAPRAAPAASDGLTPLQRAGQLVILRFRGTTAPDYVLRALRERRAAGVILFADNIASPAQLRALTAALQRAAGGRALISADQEGGVVHRIPWLAPGVGQPRLATTASATAQARRAGRELRAAGVNVTFAPVADVAAGPVVRARAFPGDAGSVSALAAASVRGYRGTGVAPTVKHFPGLGAASANTDFAPARARAELAPFRAAIGAGVPLVMASHAVYPALDARRLASQSPAILRDLLRRRLGYRGVVVTDSLEARAVVRRSPTPVAAVRSVAAGADLALTTGRGSYLPVLRALVREARRSPAFRARVRESAARVLALQARLRGR
jgi:beta-N-acetylhexosaminidase